MPLFAAVDIGSNSVRLSIAELVRNRVRVLHEEREVTRLGEEVFVSGALDPQAMAATVKVLKRFQKSVEDFEVDVVRVVATSATRDARNARVFSDWVRTATGWKLEVISGLEEGRLIHLGVISNARNLTSPLLLVDLGGGSCELTLSSQGHIKEMVSLPLGAVRLTREFLKHDPPRPAELQRLHKFAQEELQEIARKLKRSKIKMMAATSGTAAALAGAAAVFNGAARKEGSLVTAEIVRSLAAQFAEMNVFERKAVPGVNAKRAEIIVAGAAVFSNILDMTARPGFRYLKLGLRDGMLAQMASDFDAKSQTRRQVDADRQDSVLLLCKRYGVDVEHAAHVRELALALCDRTRTIHNMPPEVRECLAAAAMLFEVGFYVARAGRHRHTRYLLANSEMFGYSPEQRELIATIARYQGKSYPLETDRVLKQFDDETRLAVLQAIAILRVARALDQGRRKAVRALRVRLDEENIHLTLRSARQKASLEIWAAEKETDYFREVFGRGLLLAES